MNILTLISKNPALTNVSSLLARVGLATLFILTSFSKIQYFDATAQYMASAGLPEFFATTGYRVRANWWFINSTGFINATNRHCLCCF